MKNQTIVYVYLLTGCICFLIAAPIGQPAPILRANGSRSVVISWSKPLETNGIILLYDIQRRLRGQVNTVVVGTVNATISANVYVDRSVKPWTAYEFRVIARTVAGGTAGPYSSVKTPQGGKDFPISNLTDI